MAEYRGHDHIIRISAEEGLEIFHPQFCGKIEIMKKVWDYSCDIGRHVYEWGTDLHLKDVPEGIYLAQYWATPPGWAGPNPIEADDGIELERLEINETFWETR